MHAQTIERMLACMVSCSNVERKAAVAMESLLHMLIPICSVTLGLWVHRQPEHALPCIADVASIGYYNQQALLSPPALPQPMSTPVHPSLFLHILA